MQTLLTLVLAVTLLAAGADAGKKNKKCKADAELREVVDALTKTCGHLMEAATAAAAAEHSYEAMDGQTHFWPLNREFGGKDLVNDNTDLVTYGVDYEDAPASGEADATPAHFEGGAYADILDNPGIMLDQSFSFMASVYRLENGDGPIFEWDDASSYATHIWVYQNKFFVNVVFDTCVNQGMLFTVPVENNRWYVLAVSFDAQTKMIYMTVDGVREEKQAAACDSNLKNSPNAHVNRRLNDNVRRLMGFITCISVYDRPVSYDTMYDNTISFCKNE